MRKLRVRMATSLAVVCLGVVTASPIAAQGNGNGNGHGNAGGLGNGQNGNGNAFGHDKKDLPSMAETPELSSLVLFGTGAAGVAGYALMRIRAGRRQDDQEERASRS
jgi:hypothetical protein